MKRAVLPFLALLVLVVWVRVFNLSRAAPLEITFLNVGQGDATLVEIDGIYQVLVDGGPGRTVLRKLSQELSLGDRTIDLVLVSHDDKDHAEGARFVREQYEVGEFMTLDREEGRRGSKIRVGRSELEILSPEKIGEIDNQNTIVARLTLDDFSVLFTSDIDKYVEEDLMSHRLGLESSVLKVAHHGSNSSSGSLFLSAVAPSVSVIQVGEDNSYGHPSDDVLDRIREVGSEILRTDKGDVKILSDGNNLIIK